MNPRPEVIRELRTLFKEGATPSRLLRHIAERHEREGNLHSLIQSYFRDAFGIPIVRGLNPSDDYHGADLRYAFLNEKLVNEIIQRRSVWDNTGDITPGGTSSWLDEVKASDDQQRISKMQSIVLPELSRCWSQLTPKEQHFIQRSLASANGLYETVKILARLVECLQQRLAEEEAKC